ncbi:MAG: hypothetical protein HY868_00635 [Chloroflexi bacterium]|nr:hypothetical protein [Chloroflexota bacterium]
MKFFSFDARDKIVWFVIAACSAALLFSLAARFSMRLLWDDAFMFARYADNLLTTGKIAWNANGEPTYGLTSLLYLAIVVPLYVLTRDNPALTMWLASVLCALVFLFLLFKLVTRPARNHPRAKSIVGVLVFFTLANSTNRFFPHIASGMDTMFALAYLTAYLLLVLRNADAPSRANVIATGVWGGLAFWARPDLMVFTVVIPASIFLLDANRAAKRGALTILAITIFIAALELALGAMYFGTPLPLPFFAKALKLYGDSIYARYASQGLAQLEFFAGAYGFLAFIIALPILYDFKRWWRATPASHKGMFAASFLFVIYYAFFALQIMGINGRFYFPTLPILLFLAAQSIVMLAEWLPRETLDGLRAMPARIWFVLSLALVVLVSRVVHVEANWMKTMIENRYVGVFNLREFYPLAWPHLNWYRLDEFAALPDPLTLATTEVGYPSVLASRDTIVDLAGLNTEDFARPPFRADLIFQKYQPDVIYLPHPHYEEMVAAILNDEYFKANYEYKDAKSLNTLMGVAIARTSPQYPALKQIFEKGPTR